MNQDYTPEPIQVGESAVPSQIMSLVRDGLLGVSAWAVGQGYIDAVTGSQAVSVGLILLTIIWRQWVTRRTHSKLVVTAAASPNDIARVKR